MHTLLIIAWSLTPPGAAVRVLDGLSLELCQQLARATADDRYQVAAVCVPARF